jgi:hypothetical protein
MEAVLFVDVVDVVPVLLLLLPPPQPSKKISPMTTARKQLADDCIIP